MRARYLELGKVRFVPKGPHFDDEARQYAIAAIPADIDYHIVQKRLLNVGSALPLVVRTEFWRSRFPAEAPRTWNCSSGSDVCFTVIDESLYENDFRVAGDLKKDRLRA